MFMHGVVLMCGVVQHIVCSVWCCHIYGVDVMCRLLYDVVCYVIVLCV